MQQPEDLRTTLFINQAEALQGTIRIVTLPGKRRITLSVPAGVHDGEQIRLEGEGQPSTNGGTAGDLVITIRFRQTQEFSLIAEPDDEPTPHALRIEDTPTDPLGSMPTPHALRIEDTPTGPLGRGDGPPPSPLPNIEDMPTPLPDSSEDAPTGSLGSRNAPFSEPARMESMPPFPLPPTSGNVSPFNPQSIANILTRGNSFIRRLPPRRILLLIGLLLLVIAGSIGLFSYTTIHQQAMRNAIATTTAISATRTAQAPASYPFSTILLLSDPLQDNSKGNQWESDSSCSFTGGAYHASISLQDRFYTCIALNFRASNFTYEVRMQIIKGDCGGIIFRRNGPRFYYFRVCTDGSYTFTRYTSDTNTALNLTLGSGTHPAIHQGLNQANLLAVVVLGSKLDLYVNRQLIASVKDTSYTDGQIGLVAKAKSNATEVVFSNLMIWKL